MLVNKKYVGLMLCKMKIQNIGKDRRYFPVLNLMLSHWLKSVFRSACAIVTIIMLSLLDLPILDTLETMSSYL